MSRISEKQQASNLRVTSTELAIRDAIAACTNQYPDLTVEEILAATLRVATTQSQLLRSNQ